MADVFLGSVYAKLELRDGDLGSAVASAKKQLSSLDKSMGDSAVAGQNSATRISQAFGSVSDSLSGVDSMLTKITGGIAVAGTAALGLGITSGLKLAQQLEDAKTGLSFILKSSSEAETTMARVRKEAERTPFDVGNLSKMTQQLATFTKDGDKAVDVIMAMGSATVASGADINDMQRGIINLGQAFNNAWTFADYRQMLNAIPMFKTIADEYGFTWEKMQKIQKSGTQNLGEELTKIFQDWGQKNDVFAETQNNLSQLKASFQETFTGAFYDAMKASGAIETIKDLIAKTRDGLEQNKGVISDVFKNIASVIAQIDFAAVFTSAAQIVSTLAQVFGVLLNVFTSVATFIGGGDLSKGIDIMAKILIYATLGVKGLRMLTGAASAAFGIFGKLGGGIGKVLTPLGKFSGKGVGASAGIGNAIANILRPLGDPKVLLGAASVVVVGLGLTSLAFAFNQIAGMKVDLAKLGIMALAVPIAAGIFAIVGTFGVYAAIGGIATAIIGGGLAAVAAGMAFASKKTDEINYGNLLKLSGMIATVALVMAAISVLSIFAAIGSIATSIISGGLVLTSLGLAVASKHVNDINEDNIDRLVGIIAKTTLVLSAISALSVFAAIGSVISSVIAGGVALAAIQLSIAAEYARRLKPEDLDKLGEMLKKISEWDTGGIFKNLSNMVSSTVMAATARMVRDVSHTLSTIVPVDDKAIDSIKKNMKNFSELETGGVMKSLGNMLSTDMLGKTARNIKDIITTLSGLKSLDNSVIDSLKKNMTSLSELETGGVMKSLGDMWASDNLQKVAENIKKIVNDLTGLKAPDEGTINSIKTAITNLSKIEIAGNGLFQNKGADAEQLAYIVWKIRDMANNLNGIPAVDYGKVAGLVNAIKLFDRIDDNARNGIRKLNELGDSMGNINWIKSILGNVPEGIWENTLRLINSIKLFDRIDDNARNGAMRLATMKDSLGNIDWVKKILGDVPADLPTKAQSLVDAINKLGGISVDAGRLRGLGLNMVNQLIDGLKSGIGSIGNVGAELQGAFWRAIQAKMSDEFYQGVAMANQFMNGLRSKNGDIASVGRNMQGALWNAIQGKMQDEYWQGAAMAGKFVEGLKSKNGEFYGVGSNAVQGFINGANSKDPYSTGWNIAARFLQGLKDKGKEGSPWKTTFQSGKWAGEGLANGIMKSENDVLRAATTLAEAVTDTMNLDNMGRMMVTPDMASMNASVRSLSSTIDTQNVDRPNEVAIYGGVTINAGSRDGESILEELARATMLTDKGMATGV